MKERTEVETVTDLLIVIDLLVAELHGIAGAKAARDREDVTVMTGDVYGEIHTKGGVVHIRNEDGVGPASDFAATGLFCLTNRNSAAAVDVTNHNEAEGAASDVVVDDDLENYGAGNQRGVMDAPFYGKFPPLLPVQYLSNKALHPMKRRAEIGKRIEEVLETLQFNWGTWPSMF